MSPETLPPSLSRAAERRPALWPWLLMPLVTLALFFALRAIKEASLHGASPGSPLELEHAANEPR